MKALVKVAAGPGLELTDVPDPTPEDPTDPEMPTNPLPVDPAAPDPSPGVFDPGSVPDTTD